jgi:hypothetical protein
MSPGVQNLKTGPDTLGTAKNEFGSAKHEIGQDTLGTAGNEFESAKHENGTRLPRYRQKRVWEGNTWKRDPTPPVPPKMSLGAQNMKKGQDALGTAGNESGSAKHENGTRRPRYRRKRVREHKT